MGSSVNILLKNYFNTLSGDSSAASLEQSIRRGLAAESYQANPNWFSNEDSNFEDLDNTFGGCFSLDSGLLGWARSDSGIPALTLHESWIYAIAQAKAA